MKRMSLFGLTAMLILSVMLPSGSLRAMAAEGRTFYVAQTGNDNNDGSLNSPWKTIQKAANTVAAGDTVYIRGGTYNEKVVMKTSGQSGAYITFQNYGSEKPVISGNGLAVGATDESSSLIFINSKSYIKINGLQVSDFVSTSTNVPVGIRVVGSGFDIQILNCTINGIKATGGLDRNAHGIAVFGTNGNSPIDGIVIDGCEVYGNILGQSESVVLNGNVTNFRVTNNKIHDSDNIGVDFIGFEGTATQNDQARNGVCSDNQVWNISSAKNPTYKGDACADGIYVDGGKNIVIERNKVWNCDIGIEAASEHRGKATENVTIRNNLVYGCKAVAGIAFGGYDKNRGSAKGIKILNNTLYDNAPNILVQYNCQTSDNVIKNNILYMGTAISGTKGQIVISNNITNNPIFVSVTNGDFHLSSSSPAIDAGVYDTLCGDTDLDKKPRVVGNAIDCGAYELQ